MQFDQIASKYDLINRILSGGVDLYWRRKVGSFLPNNEKIKLLDCATGTGDQLLTLLRNPSVHQAVGIDIAPEMIAIGQRKLKPQAHRAELKIASATAIPYLDHAFDVVTMSFGIRNVDNVNGCLQEIYRVLAHRGRVLILEFSIPQQKSVKKAYLLYLNQLLPKIGKLISAHSEAYSYLSRTIQSFPHGEQFCDLMRAAGFQNVKAHPLSFGIVTIYQGDKE
jgi:demethylmenaquinone methyltransferase/2-methoxy-6-polyprenyl-1,4-benzoquinol methylase